MKSLTLFNNKGGVGKTTMTFNLAHMFARLGRRVAIMDCDPQCNLTALALPEEDLTALFEADVATGRTVASCLERIRVGNGDLYIPTLVEIGERLCLLPGDLALSRFEGKLAKDWSGIFSTSEAESSIHVTTAMERLATLIANESDVEIVLFDVGPSLGALNRAVLLACDAVVIPLAPDLFSLRGLENVGEALNDWRDDWAQARIRILQAQARAGARRQAKYNPPEHALRPIGYVIQQHLARDEVPLKAYGRWAERIPEHYARFVLGVEPKQAGAPRDEDPHCLSHLRHFASLVPLAQTARKPIFELKHADGVLGSQFGLVERARVEFCALAQKILARLDAT